MGEFDDKIRELGTRIPSQREHIRAFGLQSRDSGLEHLDETLIEQRDAGGRSDPADRRQTEFRRLARDAERPEALGSLAFRHGVRDVGDRLGSLG